MIADGFGLLKSFIDRYRIVTKYNCSAIINSPTPQFTTALYFVLASLPDGDSVTSHWSTLPSQNPPGLSCLKYLYTDLTENIVPQNCNANASCGYRSDRLENTVPLLPFYDYYQQRQLFTELLLSSCLIHGHCQSTGLYATVLILYIAHQ